MILYDVCLAMQHRQNETFWKIFSGLILTEFEAYSFEQCVRILNVFDVGNGQ